MSLCNCRNIAVFWSCVIVGIAYSLYTPIPYGFTEPWKLQSTIGEYLGYGSKLNITRAFINAGPALVKSSPDLQIANVKFDGVPVRIYKPVSVTEPAPALLFFHGGGWTFMSIDSYDFFASSLARRANIVVASVEYRLAPDYPFPVPFDDCLTSALHLLRESSKYGIDSKRVAVGGDSAGGNLAAAVAQRLSLEPETSIPKLKLQLLIYPVLQASDFNLPSYVQNKGMGGVMTKTEMIGFWMNYLGIHPKNASNYLPYFATNTHTTLNLKQSEFRKYTDIELLPKNIQEQTVAPEYQAGDVNDKLAAFVESKITNPYCAPLVAADLSQLPPTYIVNAEFDILRDEGLMYGERLRRAGVKVEMLNVKSAFHGFLFCTNSSLDIKLGQQSFSNIIEYLKKTL